MCAPAKLKPELRMPRIANILPWPPWPNGQGVGLLIRRLRVRVPQGVTFGSSGRCVIRFLWQDSCGLRDAGEKGFQAAAEKKGKLLQRFGPVENLGIFLSLANLGGFSNLAPLACV